MIVHWPQLSQEQRDRRYYEAFRMDEASFNQLLALVRDDLSGAGTGPNQPLDPRRVLVATLYWLASGCIYRVRGGRGGRGAPAAADAAAAADGQRGRKRAREAAGPSLPPPPPHVTKQTARLMEAFGGLAKTQDLGLADGQLAQVAAAVPDMVDFMHQMVAANVQEGLLRAQEAVQKAHHAWFEAALAAEDRPGSAVLAEVAAAAKETWESAKLQLQAQQAAAASAQQACFCP
eukprot:scaffold40.g5163.t1